ncbi:pterin-4-alpha-carbinolamine dehydratase family protein [Moelleriella libera RCEF 2490]|uniref:4a-hydroxytetrahydrobiopterin dehydratase n=1 Tax=Moelleriella libera RCEF 2490 TaxID=1081109 RepID=A0A167XT69_9HYPO|nr:pterin-4-alpha-carbinolamine dehydratase family protein [Moelleriella libera RCEF 2490]
MAHHCLASYSTRPLPRSRRILSTRMLMSTGVQQQQQQQPQPRYSPGTDEQATTLALTPLLISSQAGGRWTLSSDGTALERIFQFKSFNKTWVYNTTFIRWTTHNPAGLSEKDVTLAALCDALAKDMGDNILITDPTKSEVRRLVDQVCVRTKV